MPPAKPNLIGAHGKGETMRLFASHVSSGKARFYQDAGIDFVLGRREGPYLWDLDGENAPDRLPLQRRRLQFRPPQPGNHPGLAGQPAGTGYRQPPPGQRTACRTGRKAGAAHPGANALYRLWGERRRGDRPGDQAGARFHPPPKDRLGSRRLPWAHRAFTGCRR